MATWKAKLLSGAPTYHLNCVTHPTPAPSEHPGGKHLPKFPWRAVCLKMRVRLIDGTSLIPILNSSEAFWAPSSCPWKGPEPVGRWQGGWVASGVVVSWARCCGGVGALHGCDLIRRWGCASSLSALKLQTASLCGAQEAGPPLLFKKGHGQSGPDRGRWDAEGRLWAGHKQGGWLVCGQKRCSRGEADRVLACRVQGALGVSSEGGSCREQGSL